MKKFNTIFFLLILTCAHILAQNEESITKGASFRYSTTKTIHQAFDSLMFYGNAKTKTDLVSILISKTVYTRDDEGNTTVEETFKINSENKLVPSKKLLKTYEPYGKVIKSMVLEFDSASQNYFETKKTHYYYPVNDVCIETNFAKNGENWEKTDSLKVITTYNPNQDPIEAITYIYHENKWRNYIRKINEFDEYNRVEEKNEFYWDGQSWQISERNIFDYGMSSKLATVINFDLSKTFPLKMDFMVTPSGIPVNIERIAAYSMIVKRNLPIIEMIKEKDIKKKETVKENNTTHDEKVIGFYVNAGDEIATVSVFSNTGKLLMKREVRGTDYVKLNSVGKGDFLVKITMGEQTVTRRLNIK